MVLQALPQWAARKLEVILISPLIDKLSRRDFISDEEKAVLADVVAPPVLSLIHI